MSSRIDAEIVARSNVDNLLDEKISKSMTFGGTSTIYPTNPTVGTFAIVSGVPYVYDGSRWLKLQGEEEVQPGSLSFLDIAFSNKPPDGYSALNKADFLRYVFGDDTPTTYDDTNKDGIVNAGDSVRIGDILKVPLWDFFYFSLWDNFNSSMP